MKTLAAVETFAGIAGVILVSGLFSLAALAQDHAHHHGAGVPDMDEDGKRLESYQVRHDMDDETLEALRERIDLYRGMTDMEINLNMSAMGPNYEWYASDRAMRGNIGVLILSHGVGENSDRMLKESLYPVSERWPTAIGFGMAMMQSSHLQSSVDDLVEQGAGSIVLVPNGTTTEYNSLTRQWKYVFRMSNEASYLDVPRVDADVPFVMASHFADHPLITEILYDHAMEVSTDPASEVVILVAHGPEDIEDNEFDLQILSAHMERIKQRGEFADVKIINLQDDAIPPVRESNVRTLRRWVKQAESRGQTPIVVALAAASHGVQTHMRQDLRGLDYVFADKGMSEHPAYVQWVESVVEEAIQANELVALRTAP